MLISFCTALQIMDLIHMKSKTRIFFIIIIIQFIKSKANKTRMCAPWNKI